MTLLASWLAALPWLLALAFAGWMVSVRRRNAGLVDIFWSLFFLTATACFALSASEMPTRAIVAAVLVMAWSLRLAMHLALRNWGAPEDSRYAAIRARNDPGFAWKSLYLVFGFQAVLAWTLCAPLAAAIGSREPWNLLDYAATGLATFGIGFEAAADGQLARFKAVRANAGRVMESGLWRYSRHPNYFGEACTWWGFGLLATAAGAWWTLYASIAMTWLLVRVTGVPLLERGLAERRPGYREYVDRTSAFIPWKRKGA